jgi:hypothetical protein
VGEHRMSMKTFFVNIMAMFRGRVVDTNKILNTEDMIREWIKFKMMDGFDTWEDYEKYGDAFIKMKRWDGKDE